MNSKFDDLIVMSDFDGTISAVDTNTIIWEAGSPGWRDRFQMWLAGQIPERVHMAGQYEALRLSGDALLDLIRSFEIDETFPAFAQYCSKNGIYLEVISSGTTFIIRKILERYGVELPIVANELLHTKERYRIEFPYHCHPDCPKHKIGLECATCKVQRLNHWVSMGKRVVFIGDGESDIALIEYIVANQISIQSLFAKDRLADYCARHHYACTPYECFSDILVSFKQEDILQIK